MNIELASMLKQLAISIATKLAPIAFDYIIVTFKKLLKMEISKQLIKYPSLDKTDANKQLVNDVITLVSKSVFASKNKVDEEVFDLLIDEIKKRKSIAEPTDEETVNAGLGVMQFVVNETPTKKDDTALFVVKSFFEAGGLRIFGRIREWIIEIRRNRKNNES